MLKPFQPAPGATIKIANATSASSPAMLPQGSDQFVLYNSSATATVFVRLTGLERASDSGQAAVVDVDMPVPPSAQIRLTCGYNHKTISAIASDADGVLYVTPGHGN